MKESKDEKDPAPVKEGPPIDGSFADTVQWAGDPKERDDSDAMLQQYGHARGDVQHDDERRWTLFGAFLLAETLLATLLDTDDAFIRGAVALLGLVSTFLLGVAIWRNHVYLKDRVLLASILERRVGPPNEVERFYDPDAGIPEQRLKWQKARGLWRDEKRLLALGATNDFTAWMVIRTTLYGGAIGWFAVFLDSMDSPRAATSIASAAFALLVAADLRVEMRQRGPKDKKETEDEWKRRIQDWSLNRRGVVWTIGTTVVFVTPLVYYLVVLVHEGAHSFFYWQLTGDPAPISWYWSSPGVIVDQRKLDAMSAGEQFVAAGLPAFLGIMVALVVFLKARQVFRSAPTARLQAAGLTTAFIAAVSILATSAADVVPGDLADPTPADGTRMAKLWSPMGQLLVGRTLEIAAGALIMYCVLAGVARLVSKRTPTQ